MATRRSARIVAQAELKLVGVASGSPPTPLTAAGGNGRKRKATDTVTDALIPTPSTPTKRRAQPGSPARQPVTPQPHAASYGGATVAHGSPLKKPRAAAVSRLADPRITNAQLISPMTSRLVATKPVDAVSPSKAVSIKTTTENILEEACRHLVTVDARMKPLIERHPCRVFSPEGLAEKVDPFECLAGSIISQQVSGAAAKSIEARFVALFHDGDGAEAADGRAFPQPAQVAPCSIETLRTAGLSQRKAEYIKGLAEKFCSGELTGQMLVDAPYDELVKKLVAVRGLGLWSVEMFAVFGLKRMDVFSVGDLGVQRGMAAFVGRDVAKLKAKGGGKWKYMSEADMREISDRFAPYRSVFMWYMWRVEATDISTLEKPRGSG